jgi:hypothetical protein
MSRKKNRGKVTQQSRPTGTVAASAAPATAPSANVAPVHQPPELTAGGTPDTAHGEFIWKVHPYTNDYIRFADTKAAAVIAWCVSLISLLFASKAHHRFIQAP